MALRDEEITLGEILDLAAAKRPRCRICGCQMPEGEEMFEIHGYSGPCPKQDPVELAKADARNFGSGFYRRHPDGRLEHIPAHQVTICIPPNTQED